MTRRSKLNEEKNDVTKGGSSYGRKKVMDIRAGKGFTEIKGFKIGFFSIRSLKLARERENNYDDSRGHLIYEAFIG